MMGFIVRVLGSIVGMISSLPMPWKLRVGLAAFLDKTLSLILRIFPQIYQFIIGQNRRYEMGKQHYGEMQSIMEMEVLMRELDAQGVTPEQLKTTISKAEEENIGNIEFPRFIAKEIFGEERTKQFFHRLSAF